ncbi:hypothetical protein [Arcobacter porcinus]|uniref:Lipoprotein n=1 Tax=Arcobacter porcinus TaxID=1935204 RepID=A0A1C0AX79_9BACT|nr:hypothetical protein [Arcobacter porcinus]OCL97228.1 hypothetical protein AAX27_00135 [Aliarcobacter thereius]OCL84129.1 hypothetical protein AAW30_00502 [Arcobacter porcinus]OCL84653.1 hypothetical protein AAW29_00331 [Arcobacter porcinus]OCL89193.1 hypothetical protein AAX30_00330 [Arcobacter porcinus]OCL91613.1 hypothetical protein AAX28_01358 [Arcobacter porcinus]
MKRVLICFLTLASFSLCAENTIIDLTPHINYSESQRYEKDFPSKPVKKKDEKKSAFDVNVDVDVNKEEQTIDKFKFDVQTEFKGIN